MNMCFYQRKSRKQEAAITDLSCGQGKNRSNDFIALLRPYQTILPQSSQEEAVIARQTLMKVLRLMERCSISGKIAETDVVKCLGHFYYVSALAYLWEVLHKKEYVEGCHELYDVITSKVDGQFFTQEIFTSVMDILKETIMER